MIESGHSVIITGSGTGLGRGVALAFAAHGARVIVAAPDDNGRETEGLIRARGGEAYWVECDVTSRRSVDELVEAALRHNGGINTVIHNAASRRSSDVVPLEDCGVELWDEHSSVTLRGSYYLAQACLPYLKASQGRYIMLTSPSGMEGAGPMPLYSAVKAAVRGLTKSLAREWAPYGIKVAAVSPLVMTPALERFFGSSHLAGHEDRLRDTIPLGYIGDAEADLGPAFVFLASDDSRYITGQTLPVDGGRFMSL